MFLLSDTEYGDDVCRYLRFFTRRNLLATLISVELMLNATNINLPCSTVIFIRVHLKAISSRSSHSHLGGGNGCGYCHYDKCVP